MKKSLFPVDYRTRDTRKYLYLFPSYSQSVRISHSFANFHNATLLELFTQFASMNKQIVVPLVCFAPYRKNKITDKFFTWQIGKHTYALIPANEMDQQEKQKYVEFLEELKWNK